MYARTVEGNVLTFGVSGKLVRNSLIMFDRETRTLWSHLTGVAIEGPLQGSQLDMVAATQTSWRQWRRANPGTRVLGHDYPGQRDSYAGYFNNRDAGILGAKRTDARLPAKAKIVGIRVADHAKAYRLDAVIKARAVNDVFEDIPLVVLGSPPDTAQIFRRDLPDRTLTFAVGAGGLLTDRETGSTWDALTGKATAGPLDGASLVPVPATTSFWFGWVDFFPGTALYR